MRPVNALESEKLPKQMGGEGGMDTADTDTARRRRV